MKKKVLFAVAEQWWDKVVARQDRDRAGQLCDVIAVTDRKTIDKQFLADHVADAHVVVTSWDTAGFDDELIGQAPNLELLAHAAGSVKPIVCDALWDKGVKVTSAAAAIAFGVAEFCLGMILTAPKRVFWAAEGTRKGLWQENLKLFNGPREIYQQRVGVIGAGHVGRHLIRLLQGFTCEVVLYDPFVSDQKAKELGATKVETLEELFETCAVVSLNAPTTEETKGMIRGKHFALLADGATFINTARSALVNVPEMIAELKKERFIACIDITDPEPATADDPLRSLPNVIFTPHEAGTIAENLRRVGTFAVDEIEAHLNDQPLHYEVTREALKRMA